MDLETAQTTTTAKLPILKQGEYDMWRLRIEQYFQVQDYALWDVIENGNSFKPAAQTTTNAAGTSTTLIPGPVTTKEKVQKKNDVKVRSMLLMALPNEHLMNFNQYKDACAPSKESHDPIFNRLQKIRNKPDLDIMSFDDLYNNFKIVEQEVKGTASSISTANTQVSPASTQVSTASTQVSTANLSDDIVYAFLASQPNGSQLIYEDLEQIHEDYIEEMDLKWQLALLSMRTRRECIGPRKQERRNKTQDSSRRTVNVEETSSKAIVAIDGAEEFQQHEFEGYGPKPSKSVSEDTSNDLRESHNAPLVKKLMLDDKLEKKTVFPTVAKIEFVRPKQQEKPFRKPFKYAEMYRQKEVNAARPNSTVVNTVRENQVNAVKASACWFWRPTKLNSASITLKRHNYCHPQKEDQGYVDSGCSRLITGNMSYLSYFKEFDAGYGGAKGEKITSKGTLKTGDFVAVYFVKELQFNLFSVSQMCDKKNSVLFTNTGCFVLSPDFKLANKCQVLLKVPRKNNMYSIDMKNIVPKKCLTCLVAKDTLDESMIWHRSLGAEDRYTDLLCGTENDLRISSYPKTRPLIELLEENISSALSFMRPFGCHGNILNTLDYLGKFDGKSDEGFFVGYLMNSKAFRKDGSLFDSSLKNASNDETKPSSDAGKKDVEGVCKESGIADQEKSKNSTQGVNTAGPSINTEPDMFSLGDNATLKVTHADFFGDETEVDMSNITTTYLIPSNPNTRIHKDHSLDHMIGDIDVKSAFMYGKIEGEVYVCQPIGFEDPEFPDRVYKVEKALYDLHQAPRACDILLVQVSVDDIIFGFTKKMLCTEFEKLMHKKFQIISIAYSYSDYAGASLDMKSTIGGCQFIGSRLISTKYARALVEVLAEKELMEAIFIAIPYSDGKAKLVLDTNDGFVEVNKKKGKAEQPFTQPSKPRQVAGIRFTKPKLNLQYRRVDHGASSESQHKGETSNATKKDQGIYLSSKLFGSSALNVKEVSLSNSFAALGDEEDTACSDETNWLCTKQKLTTINKIDSEEVDEEIVMDNECRHTKEGSSTPVSEVPNV
ncbi:ribonuclease H-like domain-containing protein [Tanacetum coccineum]